MSWFDTIVVQPIFNILMALYALIPGNDFGIAVILFAIIVRLAMWPLIKKQLHQTKLQRAIQPELKKIKQRAAGDKQLEGRLMMELYKERGINLFTPLGVLAVQLPVFIALYQVIMMISAHRDKLAGFFYEFMKGWDPIAAIIANTNHLNESFLRVVDLTRPVIYQDGFYLPALALALIAAFFQWYQSKQITPQPADGKRLRDIMRQTKATGEQVDQAELSAAMGSSMLTIIPIIALASMVLIPIPGALLLFYAVSSIVAVIQQRQVLSEDVEDMEAIVADVSSSRPVSSRSTTKRARQPVEAEVVQPTDKVRKIPKPVQKRRKGSKVR